jgi:predicted TIM-barrel fold metal-dependent hydrolase
MSTTETAQTAAPVEATPEQALSIVDSDVHQYFSGGLRDLLPYMTDGWRHRLGIGLDLGWAKDYATSAFVLPKDDLYINSAGGFRRDAAGDGAPPGTIPEYVGRHLLDQHGIDRAVLIGGHVLGLGAMPDADVAATIASAYNEWVCEKWLEADARYRATITVAPQDPVQAAEEIRRAGDRRGVVGVFVPLGHVAMGERHYHPIYEAAEQKGLPVFLHPSGTENIFVKAPRMSVTPTYYLEWHSLLSQPYQSHLASMICHGIFERFPDLKLVIAEGGFAWAIELLWRLDRDWQGLRDEVPWLKKDPSEYVYSNVRFTTQPFLEPKKREHLLAICEMIEAERTLVFSSDYPHWDFDNPKRALAWLPGDLYRRICVDNPRELYGNRLYA